MEDFDEQAYWLAFSNCYGIGPGKFAMLMQYFGSAKAAWIAPLYELRQSGIGPLTADKMASFREKFSIEKYLDRLEKAHVSYITAIDNNYPSLLREISNPPFVLYVKGDINLLISPQTMLAVVGTRRITEYGKHVTALLVNDLVKADCVIVSGLAMGVDAIAHKATLTANGKTIAVLGSGVDNCTPRENHYVYEQIIASGGAIISESPLGMLPTKGSFPMRNRIIAGIASGVLVTEGAEDSGSLITARNALEINRPVFAVPGPITSSVSKGPIALLSEGAKVVMHAADILNALGLGHNNPKKQNRIYKSDTLEEQRIIDLLLQGPLTFDELVRQSALHASQLGTLVSLMEMKGFLKQLESGKYTLID